MNTHIDQLAEWWENAEQGQPSAGDTLIWQKPGPSYELFTADEADVALGNRIRILARASKPEPAWHDAVAVIAHTENGYIRQVWERDGDSEYWTGTEGYVVSADELVSPTPLIEAKVTDEMVERYRDEEMKWRLEGAPSHPSVARHLLTAALGLETA